MSEESGSGLGTTVVVVVLALIGLWFVWGVLGFLFGLLKGVLTLALVGLVLYGIYKLLNSVGKS